MRRRAIVLGLVLAGLAAELLKPSRDLHGAEPLPRPGRLPRCTAFGNALRELEVEPWVGDAGSFSGSDSLIGTWQQDRFSSATSGLLVAFSRTTAA